MAKFSANCKQHKYSVDGDVFRLQAEGELQVDEARIIAAEMRRVAQAEGQIYLIIALDGIEKPSPEVRRAIADSIAELPLQAAVYFGGGIVIRTVLTMINRATNLVRGSTHPISFWATEKEALAWLDDQRARQKTPPKKPS